MSTLIEELGAQIRSARERANLTQQGLADKVGVSRVMISLYENGKNLPDIKVATDLATALDAVFVVGGCHIGHNHTGQTKALTEPHQLCLKFDEDHTFAATVTIRPTRGVLQITTTAALRKSA